MTLPSMTATQQKRWALWSKDKKNIIAEITPPNTKTWIFGLEPITVVQGSRCFRWDKDFGGYVEIEPELYEDAVAEYDI